jgi:hypothetical protein
MIWEIVKQFESSTGFQPVGPTGILPVLSVSTGKMPVGPTAKMAVLQRFS